MNYKKIYDQIIQNRISNPLTNSEYGQKHHILPKSLYPDKIKDLSNIVKLSGREHYICHLLLWKYYKSVDNINGMYKMANAVSFLQRRMQVNNSRCYENIRKNAAEYISKINKGRKLTPEQCNNRSEMQKGENHYNYGGHLTEEQKQKISLGVLKAFNDPEIKRKHKDSLNTQQCKRKMRDAKLGHTPWNKGVVGCFSEETRKKISMSLKSNPNLKGKEPVNKGIKLSDEQRVYISEKTKAAMQRPEVMQKLCRKVICVDTNVIYSSIKEATLETNISNIGACCRGKIKHAGGYHWKYVDEVKK